MPKKVVNKLKEVVEKVADRIETGVENTVDRVQDRLLVNAVRVWPTPLGSRITFPEDTLPDLRKKLNIGLCFSGGGSRSASASLGQLRALHELGFVEQAKYISCISGGSWFAVPYTYLPASISNETFLGRRLDPADCTFAALRAMSATRNTYAYAVSQSQLITRCLVRYTAAKAKSKLARVDWGDVDEVFSDALGKTFLEPFGLGQGRAKLPRFFTWRSAQRDAILKRNKHLEADDFYCVTQSGRPYLIAGLTMMAPRLFDSKWDALKAYNYLPGPLARTVARVAQNWPEQIHFEGSPLYAGASTEHRVGPRRKLVGGGYVEPLGFDTHAALLAPGRDLIAKSRVSATHHRFSLADLIGTCGAAPAIATHFANEGEPSAKLAGIFPNFRHWPVKESGTVTEENYNFGDGGFIDNYGILPLLKRKVKTILCFVNTSTELTGESINDKAFAIDGGIPWLFGADKYIAVSEIMPAVFTRNKGQVFDNTSGHGNVTFKALVEALIAKRKTDRAVVAKTTHRVVDNAHYGIEGGWQATVVWFYISRRSAWEAQLPAAVRQKIAADKGEIADKAAAKRAAMVDGSSRPLFESFPHYATFLENGLRFAWNPDAKADAKLQFAEPIDLTPEQVSLLAHLSAWTVMDAKDELEPLFK